MTSLDRAFLQRFRTAAEAAVGTRLRWIRAYGSRARGDFRADSDLDVLVVVADADHEVQRLMGGLAYDLSMEMGLAYGVSVQVRSPEQFQLLLDRETLFARSVMGDGVPV